MFERSSCIEGAANQGDNLNNIGISIENFRLTWDSGFDRAEPSSLETVSHTQSRSIGVFNNLGCKCSI